MAGHTTLVEEVKATLEQCSSWKEFYTKHNKLYKRLSHNPSLRRQIRRESGLSVSSYPEVRRSPNRGKGDLLQRCLDALENCDSWKEFFMEHEGLYNSARMKGLLPQLKQMTGKGETYRRYTYESLVESLKGFDSIYAWRQEYEAGFKAAHEKGWAPQLYMDAGFTKIGRRWEKV